MSLNNALYATIIMSLVIFFTRAFPFIFFKFIKPPKLVLFIGKHIPPVIITLLAFYSIKDTNFTSSPFGLNEFFCIIIAIMLHMWRKNALISIFLSTAIYMILIQTEILEKLFLII